MATSIRLQNAGRRQQTRFDGRPNSFTTPHRSKAKRITDQKNAFRHIFWGRVSPKAVSMPVERMVDLGREVATGGEELDEILDVSAGP